MDIIKIYETINKHIDFDAMWKRATGFYNYEKYMGFKNWRKSGEYGIEEFKEAGARVEIIETPADGKTSVSDHFMPMGWDCDFAKLEILDNNGNPELLVDSLSEPLCIGLFSPPTPKEGIVTEVVHESSYGKIPWKGKFILSVNDPSSSRSCLLRKRINESGAIGVLCAWNDVPFDEPDSHQFLNSFTVGPGWYPSADEPPCILFSLSPRQGKILSDRMAKQRVRIRAAVHGKLGKDRFLTVSGALPGRQPKIPEVLAIAHMYEPFPTDDTTGASGAVEILAAIRRAIESKDLTYPKRTIRSLLAWEQYGIAYYFDRCRKRGRNFLTAINMDVVGEGFREEPIKIIHSSQQVPWGGDLPWLKLCHEIMNRKFSGKYHCIDYRGHYGDDCPLSQAVYGVPTVWLFNTPGRYHHNTQITWDKVDKEYFKVSVAVAGAYLYAMASAGESEGYQWAKDIYEMAEGKIKELKKKNVSDEKMEFEVNYHAGQVESLVRLEGKPEKAYKRYIAGISNKIKKIIPKHIPKPASVMSPMMKLSGDWVVKLSAPCLPYDLAKIPFNERHKISGDVQFHVLNWCDGKRNLAEAIHFSGLEKDKVFGDDEIRRIMRDLRFLAKYGYVDIKEHTMVTEKDFITALRKTDIKEGDTIFVHSSLSTFGKVKGGPKTVVNALKAVIGEEGLLAMPAYTSCEYRAGDDRPDIEGLIPFDPKKSPANTGAISDYFWRQKGVLRGTNPVHSTSVQGPGATEFLSGDDEKTPCCSLAGPLGNILLKDGKFVFLGVKMNTCTFLHAIEDACDMPYLTNGRAISAGEGGVIKDIPMPLFPAGPREFYKLPDNECFRKLHKNGLKKKVVKIGLGEIEIVSARNLAVASLRMLLEDPTAIVSDEPLFNPFKSKYADACRKKSDMIKKLLQLAEAGKWEEMIKVAVLKQ